MASIDNDFSHSDNELNCASSTPTNKPIPRVPPPFSRTVLPSKKLGGAFTSYVRRRGEPDGRTANPGDGKSTLDNKLRKNMTLARPGGGESDAAFTPSPPVVLQVKYNIYTNYKVVLSSKNHSSIIVQLMDIILRQLIYKTS